MVDDPYAQPIQPIKKDRMSTDGLEHAVIGDAQNKEHDAQTEKVLKVVGPMSAVISFFKKIFDKVSISKAESTRPVLKEDILFADLKKIHLLFEQLKDRDQSENINFAQALSEAWCSIQLHAEGIQEGLLKSALDPKLILSIIKEIGRYPEGAPHSLGYYLKEHAGRDWLPFPFMEILKKLHKEVALDGDRSSLSQWTDSLSKIIT